MVALSHRTARELGYTGQDESKPFVEVSGRKGLGVKADDLLDRLIAKAQRRGRGAQPRHAGRRRRCGTATMLGVSAVRYFLVKFTRTKMIAFDIDEALALRGRERAVPAVLGGAGAEHLRQAGGARRRRPRTTWRRGSRRLPADALAAGRRRRRPVGPGARSGAARRGRRAGGAHARTGGRSPSTPSAWRRRSTPSTTASRSSTRSARRIACGAPPSISAYRRQLTAALALMGIDVPARM